MGESSPYLISIIIIVVVFIIVNMAIDIYMGCFNICTFAQVSQDLRDKAPHIQSIIHHIVESLLHLPNCTQIMKKPLGKFATI